MSNERPATSPQKRGVYYRAVRASAIALSLLTATGLVARGVCKVRDAASRMTSTCHLKCLGLSMHAYHDANGHLPGANAPFADENGRVSKYPVSWRVLLLPYIEGDKLFKLYRFDEPWDGPNNIELIAMMPRTLRHPKAESENTPPGYTHYRVFASRHHAHPAALFTDGLPGPKFQDLPDGTSNIIMIVEAEEAVPWTMPEVLLYDRNQPLPKLGGHFGKTFLAAMADGSVRSFSNDLPGDELRTMILAANSADASPALDNRIRVGPGLSSGSGPEGEAAFIELKRLGFKTIISVDGATPDVALAQKHDLRYVHLPVGYDGIPRARALELAKAVRDLPGPVYVHCHHGKHRGPAAAAAIRLCLDPQYTPEEAEAYLKEAGTDARYKGLIGLPRSLKRPTKDELDRAPSDFPSMSRVPDLTRRMVEIDALWDKLKTAKEAGWKKPGDSAGEALLLLEAYREVARLPMAKEAAFAEHLTAADIEAGKLERALRMSDLPDANAAFAASKAQCARCHDEFRDRAK